MYSTHIVYFDRCLLYILDLACVLLQQTAQDHKHNHNLNSPTAVVEAMPMIAIKYHFDTLYSTQKTQYLHSLRHRTGIAPTIDCVKTQTLSRRLLLGQRYHHAKDVTVMSGP